MAKKHRSNNPSVRLIILVEVLFINISLAHISNTKEDRIERGISLRRVLRVITMGATNAVQPTIINVLKRLLPTTLPIAMSALPCSAPDILTANSGAEVPNDTMVKPITIGEILKRLAIEEAPSVRPFAPVRISPRPIIRKM